MTADTLVSVRARVIAGVWVPTARSAAWRVPIAAMAMSVAIIAQDRLTRPSADASSFSVHVQLIAALIAASAPALLDDPAATLAATSPTTRAWRTVIRVSMVLLVWFAAWALTLVLVNTAPGSVAWTDLTRQALVLLSVGIGAAAMRGTGAGAAAVGLVMFASLLLPDRWTILSSDRAAIWRLAVLAVAGVIALIWASSDPARRHRSVRSRHQINPRPRVGQSFGVDRYR